MAASFILPLEWISLGWPCCEFYRYAHAVSDLLYIPIIFLVIIFRPSLTILNRRQFIFARTILFGLLGILIEVDRTGNGVKVSAVADRLDYEDGTPKKPYRREQVRFLINRALKCKLLLVLVNHDQPNLTESNCSQRPNILIMYRGEYIYE